MDASLPGFINHSIYLILGGLIWVGWGFASISFGGFS